MKIRRRKKTVSSREDTSAEDAMDAFLNHGRAKAPPGTKRGRTLPPVEVAINEAERRATAADWEDATGRAFVGLYALCHRLVYGVVPVDLDAANLARASKLAASCLHKHFADDRAEFVEFVKWSWEREKGKEAWALRNGVTRGRLSAMAQFSGGLVTDYRVDLARSRRHVRR